MSADPVAFLDALAAEVRGESAAARARLERVFEMAPERQRELGWTLFPLRLFLGHGKDQAWIEGDFSRCRYREGDLLQLRRLGMDGAFGLHVLVVAENPRRLGLRIRSGDPEPLLDRDLVGEPTLLDLSHLLLEGIRECGVSRLGRERVLPFLLGETSPAVEAQAYLQGLDEAEALGFNPDQAEAYASCLACDLAHHVQGPPGTGKTRVLAQVALRLARAGQRVWISALSHRAIDHALAVLRALDPDLPLAKIADPDLPPPEGVEVFGYFNACPLAAMDGGYVVGATPYASRGRRLKDWSADTVILDEASQITLPLALLAMLRAERTLFFGDPHQLPPVQVSCSPLESAGRSVLLRLPLGDTGTMLRTTYRLHPDLCRWPNRHIYGEALVPAPSAHAHRPELLALPAELPALRLIHLPTRASKPGMVSAEEAERAAGICRALLAQGVSADDIAILTPFRAQARRIRVALDGLPILADTVERMQGQERDVILVSMGVSDPDWIAAMAGFLFHPARLNVALTRARGKCIVLASPALAGVVLYDETLHAWQQAFADLLREGAWR